MRPEDFDYELPPGAIARYPAPEREGARLLVLPRESGPTAHHSIRDLPRLLRPGDLLVLNDTRVMPWRLMGKRASGGKVEALLVEREGPGVFRAMVSANRPLPAGERILFPGGREAALGPPGRERRLAFTGAEGLEAWIGERGEMPIPPYLGRAAEPLDRERYQTVYASVPGAAAAPTAGLHLSEGLLKELAGAGVERSFLTLHVGPGTFRPVKAARVEDHELEAEACHIPPGLGRKISETKARGGRVVAVGTTVVRTLEWAALEAEREGGGIIREGEGRAGLFIRPGHRFRIVDALLTNFHLPRSTLLMLVCAFAGRERVLAAYAGARGAGYRFYSYGDAMLIG
ncbi:MAG: tRNA preQ1(34) S-adenosylmethionine ribosyltransferase-isomerase QueA [Candidatus Tectomicrobia bacterium]|uniref:S-adenosylmethionine:tRNA ribosyltransferase-isomerase n=1 Tax=Tectimicrobiota bacterium TaxID=2528274 RepID=A0A932HW65_UNCTE|nr:tRNA preQ1(34) S-adenosylmethionine ribosyltransferase-isomerase QueA [Candidatus Tectomicrobia bacterium]